MSIKIAAENHVPSSVTIFPRVDTEGFEVFDEKGDVNFLSLGEVVDLLVAMHAAAQG